MTRSISAETRNLQARVLSGSFILLAGSGLVTGINFAYNIAVARFLGPTAFGHAAAVYTLLILMSAITLSFQIVSAKMVAQHGSLPAKSTAYRGFHRGAWLCGILTALLLVVCGRAISNYLNLPSPLLVDLLAAGVAFYVPLGSRRGFLQGACWFRRLALNLVLEGFVRLCASVLVILLGFGVTGVVAANAAAVAIAYLFALPSLPAGIVHDLHIPSAFREALQAIVFFVGQVIINNSDIVVVKHFFASTPAGLYAAIALVGRVIFGFSWAVVNSMFPIVAGTGRQERRNHSVLGMSLLLVLGIGFVLTLGLRLAPAAIWSTLFGSQFAVNGKYGLPYLLALYAATTCLYSLSVVIIAYEMSYKIANTAWLQLVFSGLLIVGIYRFHASLRQVVWVQLVMMLLLLVMVAAPFLLPQAREEEAAEGCAAIRILRGVPEAVVIGEFLRNEFENPEFEEYRPTLRSLLTRPDFDNADDNAKRRALLFVRHGALWRQLPRETEWFEIEMNPGALGQVRVFPRAHWRQLARGDYAIVKVVRRIASRIANQATGGTFLSKIRDLHDWLQQVADPGAVLLIGLDESGPLTILDGNHRLVAAILDSPERAQRFRFFCGLSPRMAECCWYKTNAATLLRYATNLLRHLTHDPEDELARLLQTSETSS
jgi:O-antigen/teichoic acid export membrane protein